jgi:hypothetical protein
MKQGHVGWLRRIKIRMLSDCARSDSLNILRNGCTWYWIYASDTYSARKVRSISRHRTRHKRSKRGSRRVDPHHPIRSCVNGRRMMSTQVVRVQIIFSGVDMRTRNNRAWCKPFLGTIRLFRLQISIRMQLVRLVRS